MCSFAHGFRFIGKYNPRAGGERLNKTKIAELRVILQKGMEIVSDLEEREQNTILDESEESGVCLEKTIKVKCKDPEMKTKCQKFLAEHGNLWPGCLTKNIRE